MESIINFFANIFGYALNYIYNFVGNYGISIILLTLLLKLIMIPMTISQQKTMEKNKKIQKLSKEIQNKYSNDPQKMNQEIMDLYKTEKMSPFSGCLGSIVQIFIILSIFFVISRPLTYMKKIDNSIIDEYKTKISEEDTKGSRYEEINIIKKFSSEDERIYINMDFFGLDLSDVPVYNLSNWKVYIIPILYIVTSIISMRMTTNASKKDLEDTKNIKESKKEDEKLEENNIDNGEEKNKKEEYSQEEMMNDMSKNMSYIMPFMTVSIAFIAPLGLAWYWFISNICIIVERKMIDKFIIKKKENEAV